LVDIVCKIMSKIYTASDLSTKRRELLDAARSGYAQIRDRDGTGLVMVPQQQYEHLTAFSGFLTRLIALDSAFAKPASERRASDLGEFAWLSAFDEDDQQAFRLELLEALAAALGSRSLEPVETCLRDWRTTASALSNERGKRTLIAKGDGEGTFIEVRRPG
jgi:hypothetical protein